MRKGLIASLLCGLLLIPTISVGVETGNRFINKSLYKNVYPSSINQPQSNNALGLAGATKADKKTASGNSNQSTMGKRRVVKRKTNARATTAKSAAPAQKQSAPTKPSARRVVPRKSVTVRSATANARARNANRNLSNRQVKARGTALRSTTRSGITNARANYNSSSTISSQKCFADYKECMDEYCERSNTAYNRCFCSAKLTQIDSKYQPKIDSLIQEIIKLKYNTDATDAEIKAYWDSTVGVYTGTNPWVSLDNALNIDWADMESRVRGQNAFGAGHTYCVNHLRACNYMSNNMRDAYKTEITRDCATYEKALEKIQTAAESVIETYKK